MRPMRRKPQPFPRVAGCVHIALAVLWSPWAFAESPALSPVDEQKSFQLADPELRTELVAAEPLVASPCAIAWDEHGRLFVAENRGYPNTSQPPQGDIALLEDTDGDGRMDKRTVFAEGLTYPNGVLPWRGGLIVTCAPDVLFLKDTDGDGRADVRRVLLTGFDTKGSTQLRVNAPTVGPDGWIYLAAGLSGGTITAPEHPERGPLKMTADVRFNPDTLEVENVDGRSQYGMSFDEYGRRFICMNRLPVQQVVLGSRWLRRNPNLAFSDTVQDCNERSVRTGLRGGGDGVRLFPISSNVTTADSHAGSFSAACGIHLWRGGAFGEPYRGVAFSCDPTGNLVHADRLTSDGAARKAAPMFVAKEFLASQDDWFRPVFLAEGPDGALYVADMYRKVIEHPDYLPEEVRKRTDFESGKAMGRIWRVRPAKETSAKSLASLEKAPATVLVAALRSNRTWQQTTVERLLGERDGNEVKAALLAAAAEEDLSARTWARLLPCLARFGLLEPVHLQRSWNAEDAELRALVLRIWLEVPAAREWKPDPAVLAHDLDAEVRFVGALALGEMPEGGPALGEVAARDSENRWMRAAALSSVVGREEEFLGALSVYAKWVSEGVAQMVETTGRSFAGSVKVGHAVGGDREPGMNYYYAWEAALWLGVSERTQRRLTPDFDGENLTDRLDEFTRQAVNGWAKPFQRQLFVRVLGRMEWARAGKPLTTLASTEKDADVRLTAIRALAGFSEPEVSRTLLGPGRWAGYTPTLRETVLSALLGNSAHWEGVLTALEEGRLPAAAISQIQRRPLLNAKDATLRARAAKLWSGPPADRQQALEAARAALALKPDPKHGRAVFKNTCATCHRLDQEGFTVGPDLLDMRNQSKESILFHIVVPEAEVNVAYAPYLAETKDGRSFAGILASETPTSVMLRMPLGVEETILRTNLAKLEALPGSLMPAGLEQTMTRQDLADLLAFLKGE